MIYQKFSTGDVVAGRVQTVSSGFFNDGNYSVPQTSLLTDSSQIDPFGVNSYDVQNGLYYWNVYYNNQVHFSVAYGDLNNSGSAATDFSSTKIFPFSANYQSYSNLLLTPSETEFSFLTGSYVVNSQILNASSVSSPSIFMINFGANLYKNQVDPGQLQFSLSGSNGVYTFIDDSSVINKKSNVYNIISGSIINGIPTPDVENGVVNYNALGLFYPKTGTVILNGSGIYNLVGNMDGIDSDGSPISYTYPPNPTTPSQSFQTYQSCLFKSLVNCPNSSLQVRKSELIPTAQYYIRVQNANFNYTNNPTFISDGTDGLVKGTIKIPELRSNPVTYITTVGLYDDSNELLAVAKMSVPMPKSFDNEYTIKVNLAY
jgi:hypothetical protein